MTWHEIIGKFAESCHKSDFIITLIVDIKNSSIRISGIAEDTGYEKNIKIFSPKFTVEYTDLIYILTPKKEENNKIIEELCTLLNHKTYKKYLNLRKFDEDEMEFWIGKAAIEEPRISGNFTSKFCKPAQLSAETSLKKKRRYVNNKTLIYVRKRRPSAKKSSSLRRSKRKY